MHTCIHTCMWRSNIATGTARGPHIVQVSSCTQVSGLWGGRVFNNEALHWINLSLYLSPNPHNPLHSAQRFLSEEFSLKSNYYSSISPERNTCLKPDWIYQCIILLSRPAALSLMLCKTVYYYYYYYAPSSGCLSHSLTLFRQSVGFY